MKKIMFFLLFCEYVAMAHLMPRGRGTINIIKNRVYLAVSMPKDAFFETLSQRPHVKKKTLNNVKKTIRQQFLRHVYLSSQKKAALWKEVFISFPPGSSRVDAEEGGHEIVIMAIAQFEGGEPRGLRFGSSLWAKNQPAIKIRATKTKANRVVSSETLILDPRNQEVEFFQ